MFFADALILNSFLSYESIIETFKDSSTEEYIQLLVGLGVLSMQIALSFNFLKFIVNYLESQAGKQYHTKTIIFTLLDLIVTICNFIIEIFILVVTLLRLDIYPIFIIASLFESALGIVRIFLNLYQSASMATKLANLPEKLLEEIELEDKDPTCIVCQFKIEKGKQLKCGHVLHLNCIWWWIMSKSECPVCKDPITLESL